MKYVCDPEVLAVHEDHSLLAYNAVLFANLLPEFRRVFLSPEKCVVW